LHLTRVGIERLQAFLGLQRRAPEVEVDRVEEDRKLRPLRLEGGPERGLRPRPLEFERRAVLHEVEAAGRAPGDAVGIRLLSCIQVAGEPQAHPGQADGVGGCAHGRRVVSAPPAALPRLRPAALSPPAWPPRDPAWPPAPQGRCRTAARHPSSSAAPPRWTRSARRWGCRSTSAPATRARSPLPAR